LTSPTSKPVIAPYAGTIIGWEAVGAKQRRFVESAIRESAALRARQGHRMDGDIHHSDAGSKSANTFAETLRLSCLRPSIGLSDMPTTLRSRRRPLGSTGTIAFVPTHRFGAPRCATSSTSSSSPPRQKPNTTVNLDASQPAG
jgi:hypothetical protein